ncbi:MAG: hypothetical protein H0T42_31240 [Deltaproteobacteria bacterium]|nr:hypothetical protein [Deltaproteobacteria bacterium]
MTRYAIAVLLLAPSITIAAPYEMVVSRPAGADFELARQEVPTPPPTGAAALSRVIYLNRTGVTVTPGATDARLDHSSIASQPVTIPAWNPPPQVWADTVACLEAMFAPFGVELTEIDPGQTPHIEAVFGGSSTLFGFGPRVGGVAPLSSTCAVVENAMVFTFTDILLQNGQTVCETQAQEIAHAYGLDHEMLASDPMSYLRHPSKRTFQDELASCGETTARPCGIGMTSCRAQQNSYAILLERLGASGAPPADPEPATQPEDAAPAQEPSEVGCSAGGQRSGGIIGFLLLVACVCSRRRCGANDVGTRQHPR